MWFCVLGENLPFIIMMLLFYSPLLFIQCPSKKMEMDNVLELIQRNEIHPPRNFYSIALHSTHTLIRLRGGFSCLGI